MSWQVYVTDQLMTPGEMYSAGIYGVDGGEWAAEGSVRPQPHEVTRLINILQGKDTDFNGIKIGGISFLYVTHDPQEGSIILNRINAPSDKEKYVCCGYLAKSCFVYGAVVGNYRMGNCSKVSCRLRDYLKQMSGWEGHIASMKTTGADEACICGQDSNIWAKSDNFNMTPQEIATVIKAAKNERILDTEKPQFNNMPLMRIGDLQNYPGCTLLTKNDGDKVLVSVALSNTGAVVATKSGPNRNKAVDACEIEVKCLRDSGL